MIKLFNKKCIVFHKERIRFDQSFFKKDSFHLTEDEDYLLAMEYGVPSISG